MHGAADLKPRSLLLIVIRAAALAVVVGPAPGKAQPGLQTHPPIIISNDAGFSPANGVTGGDGSIGTPFLISDWNISATQANVGIQITNTHKYFIIRNVLIHPPNFTTGSTGLVLRD